MALRALRAGWAAVRGGKQEESRSGCGSGSIGKCGRTDTRPPFTRTPR